MKRKIFEKGTVVVLFVLVQVVFSFAERDSKKLAELYNARNAAVTVKKGTDLRISTNAQPLAIQLKLPRN